MLHIARATHTPNNFPNFFKKRGHRRSFYTLLPKNYLRTTSQQRNSRKVSALTSDAYHDAHQSTHAHTQNIKHGCNVLHFRSVAQPLGIIIIFVPIAGVLHEALLTPPHVLHHYYRTFRFRCLFAKSIKKKTPST